MELFRNLESVVSKSLASLPTDLVELCSRFFIPQRVLDGAFIESCRDGDVRALMSFTSMRRPFGSGDPTGAVIAHGLTLAAENGHLETVKFLSTFGSPHGGWQTTEAVASSQNSEALRRAAAAGHLPVVEFLVSAGADVAAKDYEALKEASGNGHLPVVKFLSTFGSPHGAVQAGIYEALQRAANFGHLETVKFLSTFGSRVGAEQAGINEALTRAACNGHLPVVKFLVSAGADIQHDHNAALRWTAVEFLSRQESGQLDILKYLVNAGADVTAVNFQWIEDFVKCTKPVLSTLFFVKAKQQSLHGCGRYQSYH